MPACDGWDSREKAAGPHAPYLLQGAGHPSQIAYGKIRSRLARLSRAAGARRSDGSELVLRPHDCRRVFASEHLNNNTPIHVIQALLGHASPDTVMVYAKLYPTTLVEEYRKTVRATYLDFHGPDSLRAPDAAEWRRFAQTLELRDMGTHLCALPAGEHCSRGLVCLGCSSAQPKKSAAPIFQRMLTSHQAALERARGAGEPAGQLAARELEVAAHQRRAAPRRRPRRRRRRRDRGRLTTRHGAVLSSAGAARVLDPPRERVDRLGELERPPPVRRPRPSRPHAWSTCPECRDRRWTG